MGRGAVWLRWATIEGKLLPTGHELATVAEQRSQKLAARLREMGINPEEI